jgi:hypothetical protein
MKLFWRIFLGFWLATILMLGAVLSIREILPLSFPGDREVVFQPELASPVLTKAIEPYYRGA